MSDETEEKPANDNSASIIAGNRVKPTPAELEKVIAAARSFALALRRNVPIDGDPECPARLPGFPVWGASNVPLWAADRLMRTLACTRENGRGRLIMNWPRFNDFAVACDLLWASLHDVAGALGWRELQDKVRRNWVRYYMYETREVVETRTVALDQVKAIEHAADRLDQVVADGTPVLPEPPFASGEVRGGETSGGMAFSNQGRPEPTLTGEARALALLVKDPNLTDRQIAEFVGVSRTTLYRWRRFRSARKVSRSVGKTPPRGRKDADRNLDAWD